MADFTIEELEARISLQEQETGELKREVGFLEDKTTALENQVEQLNEQLIIQEEKWLTFDIRDYIESGQGVSIIYNGGKSIISSNSLSPLKHFYLRQTGKDTVKVLGGNIRLYGEKTGTVGDTDLTLTGSTAVVYISFVRATGATTVTFSAALPSIDDAKIIAIPLAEFTADGGEYVLTEDFTGDFGFDTPMGVA